jgi:hypothetical protein
MKREEQSPKTSQRRVRRCAVVGSFIRLLDSIVQPPLPWPTCRQNDRLLPGGPLKTIAPFYGKCYKKTNIVSEGVIRQSNKIVIHAASRDVDALARLAAQLRAWAAFNKAEKIRPCH